VLLLGVDIQISMMFLHVCVYIYISFYLLIYDILCIIYFYILIYNLSIQRFLGSEEAVTFLQWKQTPHLFLLLLRVVYFCLYSSITIYSKKNML